MSQKVQKNISPLHELEFSKLLNMIAVENGLRIPKTPEEIQLFEHKFAAEIQEAAQHQPSLDEILRIANSLKQSGVPLTQPLEETEIDYKYQMAARDGNDITPEIEERMNLAIKKEKDKRLGD